MTNIGLFGVLKARKREILRGFIDHIKTGGFNGDIPLKLIKDGLEEDITSDIIYPSRIVMSELETGKPHTVFIVDLKEEIH